MCKMNEENYKSLMKGIKEIKIKYSWIGRVNIVKMSFLFNLTYRVNAIPVNISALYFVDIKKKPNSEVYMDRKQTQNIHHNIEKQEQSWRVDPTLFNTLHKATVVNTCGIGGAVEID